MKKSIFIFSFLLGFTNLFSQQEKFITLLQSLESDSAKTKFIHDYEEYYTPAGTFLNQDSIPIAWYDNFRPFIENEILKSDLELPDSTRMWISLGCKPNGEVEKIIYSSKFVKEQNLENKTEEVFTKALLKYKFPLTADKKYSQCGTLLITKNKSE